MALNLSTLTSPATSGDVLQEVTTTADFLESVPVFRNLARGSNKGGDAEQDVALNQPKALPLIGGDGYYYGSGVANNHAYVPSLGYGPSDDQSYFARCYISSDSGNFYILSTRASSIGGLSAFVTVVNGSFVTLSVLVGPTTVSSISASTIPKDTEFDYLITYNGSTNKVSVYIDGVTLIDDVTISTSTWNSTTPLFIGARGNSTTYYTQSALNALGYIKQAKAFSSVVTPSTVATATPSLNVDFTANVRHGDTKFTCATGQVVTINQSGNDPATIIKKPVLRFDGADDGLNGLLNQTITDGYFFAAYSVIGNGGTSFGRIFGLNATGGIDSGAGAVAFRRNGTSNDLMIRYNQNNITTHSDFFDDERGDYLLEAKVLTNSQKSKINNADLVTGSVTGQLNSAGFSIGHGTNGGNAAALDLEYLALFDASITDAQADAVRNYINKRNNVFSLVDNSYYFFDPQKATFTGNFTAVNTLDGYITGSDLGDTDVRSNLTLEQGTLNDQPSTDGYKITFNDSAEHLEFVNGASQSLAGWQVVGTSLGTFAYRVNANAVTELNLLGNLGSTSHRKAGDLYGIILLPESATGKDIEDARKLLIDRGAADAPTGIISNYFRNRQDIVSFGLINTSTVSDLGSAWYYCTNITSFPLIDTSSVAGFSYAWGNNQSLTSFPLLNTSAGSSFINTWYNCVSLNNFPALNMSNGTNFSGAWRGTTALTSFPADAKLGTDASNVNFSSAWRSSGLTSFSTPLPTARLGEQTWQESAVTSFSAPLPVVERVYLAWHLCSSLTDFSADVFANWNPPNILNQVFDGAWDGCTSLTAQSVENILTSIDASGHYATTNKLSGGTPLADAGIDIDYNGDPLSAATTAAITSLKSRGWSIFINSVEQ